MSFVFGFATGIIVMYLIDRFELKDNIKRAIRDFMKDDDDTLNK